jgi:hypothetical protein
MDMSVRFASNDVFFKNARTSDLFEWNAIEEVSVRNA